MIKLNVKLYDATTSPHPENTIPGLKHGGGSTVNSGSHDNTVKDKGKMEGEKCSTNRR